MTLLVTLSISVGITFNNWMIGVTVSMGKRNSKTNCSVVGCNNTYINTSSVHFYTFPGRSYEIERRIRWIQAVNRIESDGSPWQPTKNSKICSVHFVGNKKSEHPLSPSYLPTIFPPIFKKKKKCEGANDRCKRSTDHTLELALDCEESLISVNHEDSVNKKNSYKCCIVPLCKSTTITAPNKLFVAIPRNDEAKRKLWLDAVGRTVDSISRKSAGYCCEDHFNLEEDMDNWLRYKLMGGKIYLKKEVVPHIFECREHTHVTHTKGKYVRRVATKRKNPSLKEALSKDSEKSLDTESLRAQEQLLNLENVSMQLPYGENDSNSSIIDLAETYLGKPAAPQHISELDSMPSQQLDLMKQLKTEFASDDLTLRRGTAEQREQAYLFTYEQIRSIESGQGDTDPEILIKTEDDESMEASCLVKSEQVDTSPNLNVAPVPAARLTNEGFEFISMDSIKQDCHTGPQNPDELDALGEDLQVVRQCEDGNWFPCFDCGLTYASSGDLEDHNLQCGVLSDGTSQPMEWNLAGNTSCDPELVTSSLWNLIHDHAYTKLPRPREPEGADPSEGARDNQYQCLLCGKVYTEERYFTRHVELQTCERRFGCEFCGQHFTFSSLLSTHLTTHEGEQPVKCDVCSKQFCNMARLNRHQRIHKTGKLFSCHICNASFSQGLVLNKHMRVHKGEKPFTCEVCGKDFWNLLHFNMHKTSHVGDLPLPCTRCNQRFSNRSSLGWHKRQVHSTNEPRSCDICELQFFNLYSLERHKRRVHADKESGSEDMQE